MKENTPLLQGASVQQGGGGDVEHGAGHGKHGTSWVSSSSLIVANMLGAGVLGLPHAVGGMGYLGAAVILAATTAASIYGGLCLASLRGDDDSIKTYGQLADKCARKRGQQAFWRRFVQIVGYAYMMGSCTIYLTTMKISLMEILQKCPATPAAHADICGQAACSAHGVVNWHNTPWTLLTAGLAFPFIHFRTLEDSAFISYLGVGTIAIVNVIILVHCVQAASETGHSVHHKDSHSLEDFVNGITSLAFAYGGHVLMVEIQSEMATPRDFVKSVWSSQLFMLVNYAVIGFVGYLAFGDDVQSPITLNLADNDVRKFTNACLFLHVLVAYCLNSTVLCQFLAKSIWPTTFDQPGVSKRRVQAMWAIVTTSLLICCIVIATLVPFFSDLMNIYSSIGIFSLSFAVPVTMVLLARMETLANWLVGLDSIIICCAVCCCGLGVWAAGSDIATKWKNCDMSIQF